MKRKMMMSTLISMLCALVWIATVNAEAVSDFSMKTSDIESANGQFTITLSGKNIKDLYAYEAKFNFDPSLLEVVKAETTIKGFSVSPVIKGNLVTIAHTKIGDVSGEKGDLDITTITFKAKKPGASKVEWTSIKILDQDLKNQTFAPNKSAVFTKIFGDIVKHWAKADIMEMVSKGVVQGIDNDHFAPDKNITRAEFAALISRALNLKKGTSQPFGDVKSGVWYEDTVKSAYAAGIINGVTSKAFAPNKNITREEMSTMLMRAKAYASGVSEDKLPTASLKNFQDEGKISEWAKKSAGFAISSGLMKGRTTKLFAPRENATRAESAVVIKRLLAGAKS
ncbi:MAG: S-layer homology domain-containing protein [Candidatus Pristimantibacillus sp.]